MIDQLKASVDKARKRLEGIVDEIEDQFEDLSEDAEELWKEAKPKLKTFKESLISAERALVTDTEEARLQAHLAIMDAHDQWDYLSQTVTQLARHTRQKGQTELQHAELQAHLAKMETRDFMNEKGKQIRQDFKTGKEVLEKTSLKAAEQLGKSMEDVGSAWVNSV